MATLIYPNGYIEVVVPDGEKIAIFSNGPLTLYKRVGYPNYPSSLDLITQTAAGETYTSAAFTGDTTVRVEAGAFYGFYEVGSAPVVAEPLPDQEFADATGVLSGLAAAQGGSATLKGGTSSTSANAGGAAALLGGQAGATGVGGAATVTGAVGGSTSGAGGAATIAGGAGTAGNSAGGVASLTGGAGQGSASGGASTHTGGVGGATGAGGAATVTGGAGGSTSGVGGSASLTGGAGSGGNANGGRATIAGGAANGTGIDGSVALSGPVVVDQPTPNAETGVATLTIAELLTGIVTMTQSTGGDVALTLPTGTLTDAGLDIDADQAFEWSVINLSAAAADTVTINAGAGHTVVGVMVVQSAHATTGGLYGNAARFRTRKTAANTFVTYRVA